MKKLKLIYCIACAGVLMTMAHAQAGGVYDFTARLTDYTSRTVIDSGAYTGLYDFQIVQTAPDGALPIDPLGRDGVFAAHCVQRFQPIHGNTEYAFEVVSLAQAPEPRDNRGHPNDDFAGRGNWFNSDEVDALQRLWAMEFAMDNGSYVFQSSLTGKQRYAAAQKAMWTITDGITLGSAMVDNNARLFLDELQAIVDGPYQQRFDHYVAPAQLQAMVSADTQDFIGLFTLDDPPVVHTPVPGAALGGMMLIGGVGGFGLLRRKRPAQC